LYHEPKTETHHEPKIETHEPKIIETHHEPKIETHEPKETKELYHDPKIETHHEPKIEIMDHKPNEVINPDPKGTGEVIIEKINEPKGTGEVIIENNETGDVIVEKSGEGVEEIIVEKSGEVVEEIIVEKSGEVVEEIIVEKSGEGVEEVIVEKSGEGVGEVNVEKSGEGVGEVNIEKSGEGKEVVGEVAPTSVEQKNNNTPTTGRKRRTQYRAKWDFVGDESNNQFSFKAGDIIDLIEASSMEDDWWVGEMNGKEGYFPYKFCEVIKRNIKLKTDNNSVHPVIQSLQKKIHHKIKKKTEKTN